MNKLRILFYVVLIETIVYMIYLFIVISNPNDAPIEITNGRMSIYEITYIIQFSLVSLSAWLFSIWHSLSGQSRWWPFFVFLIWPSFIVYLYVASRDRIAHAE